MYCFISLSFSFLVCAMGMVIPGQVTELLRGLNEVIIHMGGGGGCLAHNKGPLSGTFIACISFDPQQNLMKSALTSEKETEAQRGKVICIKPQGREVEE